MFEIFNNTNNKIDTEELNDYIKYVIGELKIDNAIFNIIFIDNEEIRKINKEYKDIVRFKEEKNYTVLLVSPK